MNNIPLSKSKKERNDEFYTKPETAEKMLKPFLEKLSGKKVICPCDTKESEIYKYLKSNNIDVEQATKFEDVDYSKYDVVITNPPFSKIKKFFETFGEKDFIIIGSWLLPTGRYFYHRCPYWSKAFTTDWTNTDKKVNIRFYSNLFNPWSKEKQDWKTEKKKPDIVNNKPYTASVLDITDRTDYEVITVVDGDSESFKRFIFAPTVPIHKYKHMRNTKKFANDYILDENGSCSIVFKEDLKDENE